MIQKTKFKETDIGLIPEDWEETTVGIKCKIKNGKTNTQDAIDDGKYPLYDRSTQIKRSNKFLFDAEAVIIPGEGKEFFPKYYKGKFDLHQRAYAIWSENDNINVKYVYYWIEKNKIYLSNIAVGSTVKSLRLNHLENFPLCLPQDISEENQIAKILSDLDSKIELLQKQNETLEKIGQAIFKHWFVDFEFSNKEGKPYKSSGGKMVDSELGEIPEGWGVEKLSSLFKFIKGKKPNQTHNIKIKNFVSQILIENLDGKKPLYTDPKNLVIISILDPIMVMDGASSGRIEIGFQGALGSTLAKLEINIKNLTGIIYYYLKSLEKDIKQNTTGTSIPHTDKNKIYNYNLALPSDDILINEFKNVSLPNIKKIINNKHEIKNLQKTRDLLLPKLMTGKIRVPLKKECIK